MMHILVFFSLSLSLSSYFFSFTNFSYLLPILIVSPLSSFPVFFLYLSYVPFLGFVSLFFFSSHSIFFIPSSSSPFHITSLVLSSFRHLLSILSSFLPFFPSSHLPLFLSSIFPVYLLLISDLFLPLFSISFLLHFFTSRTSLYNSALLSDFESISSWRTEKE